MTPIRRAFARAMACAFVLAAGPAFAQSLISGKVNTGTPTFVTDQNVPLQLDAQGNLKVNVVLGGGGGSGGGGGATGSVTPAGTNGTSAQAIQGINGGVNVGVSAVSWPLPTGAATAANQATANISLASIDGKTPALGQKTMAQSAPVVLPSDQVLSTAPSSGSMEQDVRATGTLNAATANATIAIPINGQSTVAFTFSGLTASGATLTYEQSNDGGTTWTGVQEVNTGTSATSLTRTTDGQVRVAVQGRTNLRVRVSTPGTGTITVAWNISVREGLISLASPAQVAGLDGTTPRVVQVTTTGALEPPTAAAGKITRTSTSLTANTSTTVAAANANRIALGIQCGAGGVSIDETGAALTGASVGNGTLFIPSGTGPYFTPPVATRTAITAYTATAQTCVVTEYLR